MANTLNTGVDALGGVLVSPIFTAEVMALVYERPVFLTLTTVIPVNRRTVHLHKVSAGPSLEWVPEGGRKPTTDMEFDRDTMTVCELAGILKWSDRLDAESFASPGIRSLVQREIVAAASDRIDRDLFNNSSTDDSEIRGLLAQSGYQTHGYQSAGDLGEDIRVAIRKIRVENHEPTAVVLHVTALDKLLSIRTSQGELKYPSVNAPNPTIWGKPLISSTNVPAVTDTNGDAKSDVIVADWSTIMVATMPGSVRITDVATIDGESLFEHDKSAICYVTNVSSPLMRRPEAVCVIQDVSA